MGDFFYGEQANIFSFYRFPKALFTDSRFRGISVEAKVLPGMTILEVSEVHFRRCRFDTSRSVESTP